jgi:hypothetical protein
MHSQGRLCTSADDHDGSPPSLRHWRRPSRFFNHQARPLSSQYTWRSEGKHIISARSKYHFRTINLVIDHTKAIMFPSPENERVVDTFHLSRISSRRHIPHCSLRPQISTRPPCIPIYTYIGVSMAIDWFPVAYPMTYDRLIGRLDELLRCITANMNRYGRVPQFPDRGAIAIVM